MESIFIVEPINEKTNEETAVKETTSLVKTAGGIIKGYEYIKINSRISNDNLIIDIINSGETIDKNKLFEINAKLEPRYAGILPRHIIRYRKVPIPLNSKIVAGFT